MLMPFEAAIGTDLEYLEVARVMDLGLAFGISLGEGYTCSRYFAFESLMGPLFVVAMRKRSNRRCWAARLAAAARVSALSVRCMRS